MVLRTVNAHTMEGVSATKNRRFLAGIPTVDPEIDKNDVFRRLEEVLMLMPVEKAITCKLYLLFGLTVPEIAKHMNVSTNCAEVRLATGMEYLRDWFTVGRLLSLWEHRERRANRPKESPAQKARRMRYQRYRTAYLKKRGMWVY